MKQFFISILLIAVFFTANSQTLNSGLWVGGSDDDNITGSAFDSEGNYYITGYFKNTLQLQGSSQTVTSAGGSDFYIAKYDTDMELVWVKSGGGSTGFDWTNEIVFNTNNEIIVTGYFDTQATFGEGADEITIDAEGGRDIFVCKYDSNGNLINAIGEGGSENDNSSSVAIDSDNNIIICGKIRGEATLNGDGTNSVILTATGGGSEDFNFVAKYNTDFELLWANDYAHSGYMESFSDVGIDNNNNIFICGIISETYYDPIIVKYSPEGNQDAVYLPQGDELDEDVATCLTMDNEGNCYVTGSLTNNLHFGSTTISAGNNIQHRNIWIAKFSNNLELLHVQVIPSTGWNQARDITVSPQNEIFLTGYLGQDTESVTFGKGCHTQEFGVVNGQYEKDCFFAKYNTQFDLQYVNAIDVGNEQMGRQIIVNENNEIYFAGQYDGTFQIDDYYFNSNGNWGDIFLLRYTDDIFVADFPQNLSATNAEQYGNASDIEATFDKPYTETGIEEYRIMLVPQDQAENFSIEEANTVTNFQTITPVGSQTYTQTLNETLLDINGNDIAGQSIIVFVMSRANGTEKNTNSIACPSDALNIIIFNNTENDILTFVLTEQTGDAIISTENHTVNIEVVNGTNLTALTPTITISENATINPDTETEQDFSNPFEYTVTSENLDEQIWTVTVNVATQLTDLSANKISIHPNPSNGTFFLQNFTNSKIQNLIITDITGKIIHNSQFSIHNSQFSIEEKGIYFIKIQTENNIFTEKLIIQ